MTRAVWALLLLCAWAAPVHAAVTLIKGTVVTPDTVIANGWIAIDQDRIISITAAKPRLDAAHD